MMVMELKKDYHRYSSWELKLMAKKREGRKERRLLRHPYVLTLLDSGKYPKFSTNTNFSKFWNTIEKERLP